MPREPITFMGGSRFEGSVSGSRKLADLNDLSRLNFKSLKTNEVEEMIELLIEIREYMAAVGR